MPDPIDVHHHAYSPVLRSQLRELGITRMAPGVPLPDWTPARSLDFLDASGLSGAVLSVLLPNGAYADGKRAATLIGQVNESLADLVRDHPGRFAALAALPLNDPAAAVTEIKHALDDLGLDGVVLPAGLPGGRSLADAELVPVLAELDGRAAVAFVHPSPSARCYCVRTQLPPPVVDFVVDTTRAMTALLFNGSLERYCGIRFVLAHAGGALPFLARRLELAETWVGGVPAAQVRRTLRGLYYETAQSDGAGTLACLRAVTDESHILLGTDFPFIAEKPSALPAGLGAHALFGRIGG